MSNSLAPCSRRQNGGAKKYSTPRFKAFKSCENVDCFSVHLHKNRSKFECLCFLFSRSVSSCWSVGSSNRFYAYQWRNEAKCRPRPTTKVPLFPPLKVAHNNENERRSRFVLIRDIRNNKASWSPESNTHKLKWILFFIRDHESRFFCLFAIFLIIVFIFFLPYLHTHLWTHHISLNFLPCWLSVCGKPQHFALIVYSFSRAGVANLSLTGID